MELSKLFIALVFLASVLQVSLEERNNRWKIALEKEKRRNQRKRKGKRGHPGPVGPPGNPGPPGLPGRDGQPGIPGNAGEPGTPGDPGTAGDPGRMGQKGAKGERGDRGSQGAPGQACYLENSGAQLCINPPTGPEGPRGEKGDVGPQGDRGKQGYPGKNGIPGPPGLRGLPGRAVDAINIRCHTTHNKIIVKKQNIVDSLEDVVHAHCDPLQFLQGVKFYRDDTSLKLVYTCCSFY